MLPSSMDVVRFYYFKSIENKFSLTGGMIGAFLTGLFSQKWVNEARSADGAFYGRPIQLWYQIAGILTAIGK